MEDKSDILKAIALKDARDSYYYARDVVKGRWHEYESYILTNPCYAFYYARDVIKGRWPEAEVIIRTSKFAKKEYAKFLKTLA